jgi:hypothetical protein
MDNSVRRKNTMKKSPKKLSLQKETLSALQQVAGGRIIGYYKTVPIDDTVYEPRQTDACSAGCGSYA